jgi:pullulanase/glycogen debranching enzyme
MIIFETSYLRYVIDEKGNKDLAWYTEKGIEFKSADWHDGNRRCLSYLLKTQNGFIQAIFNANHTEVDWILPTIKVKHSWNVIFDSTDEFDKESKLASGKTIKVPSWSVLLIEIKK